VLANSDRPGPARRYYAETYAAAFILQTMSSRDYQFLRHKLIPLPQIKHVDDCFRLYIDEVDAQIANIEDLLSMFANYKELHLSAYSAFIQYTPATFAGEVISCILGVDTMAIESYSEKSKRLLLLNHAGVNYNPEHLRELEDDFKISIYFLLTISCLLSPVFQILLFRCFSHKRQSERNE
jgi:hypothetical protein